MPIQQVPGFWDFLGQGISGGVKQYQDTQDRATAAEAAATAQTRQDAQFIAQMVQSGAMDSDTANAQPAAQKLGITFQPSVAELRRKIMASPGGPTGTMTPGATTQIPGLDISGAGSGLPSVTTPATATPWTDDQRFSAGLPSSGAMAEDKLKALKTGIATKYLSSGPGSVTDNEAAVAGVPTTSELNLKKRAQLDPVVQSDATNYAANTINATIASMKIDPNSSAGVKQLTRNASSMAAAAYNQYVTDAKAAGNDTATDPANKGFIKSAFDAAISNKIKGYEDENLRNRALNPPVAKESATAWYSKMLDTSKELDAELAAIAKDNSTLLATTTKNPTPSQQATIDRMKRLQQQTIIYRKAATAFLAPKPDIDAIRNALQNDLKGTDSPVASTTPEAAKPATPTMQLDPVATAARIKAGLATFAQAQALFQKGTISQENLNAVATELQKLRSTSAAPPVIPPA